MLMRTAWEVARGTHDLERELSERSDLSRDSTAAGGGRVKTDVRFALDATSGSRSTRGGPTRCCVQMTCLSGQPMGARKGTFTPTVAVSLISLVEGVAPVS